MDFFFNPKAIAVVGATPNPFKGGCSILKNLMAGYGGRIYPINPRYEEIEGLPCYPSVSVIPDPIDLAIVFVPAKMVKMKNHKIFMKKADCTSNLALTV